MPLPPPTDAEYATAVTFREAGRLLGFHEETVRRKVNEGVLPAVQVFGVRRIRLTALRQYLDDQERDELAPRRPRKRA